MAKYERIVTTETGLELLENAAYIGGSVQFTALKTGNGTYDGTEELSTMTDLKNVCQTFGIGSVSKSEGAVIVRIVIDNNDLVEGYTMTELGLYATNQDTGEEVLYAIIMAKTGYEDYVPPYADAPTSITFEAFIELTESTEAVTFTAAPMEGVYVPVESFNEHLQDEEAHVTAEEKENWNKKQDALSIDDELDEESDNLVKNKAIAAEVNKKLDASGNASNTTVAFTEATELTAPVSGSKLSVLFGVVAKAVSSLLSHMANTSNPHSVTKTNVGLGNVPNVATNDQTPTYTVASENAALSSGEKLSVAFGKIAKAISSLITHLADSVSHVTSTERTAWNAKADASHGTHVTFSTTAPVVAGTAAVGSATTVSRSDHVHPAQTTVSGNAGSATKLATARTIDGVSFNGSAAIIHYGTCSTAAATAAKTVALTSFTLVTGAWVAVKFTVTNTASSPTLNVNSTGAKSIMYRGSAISAGYLAANRVYLFVYDGTDWELVGDINTDTNTTYTLSTITGTLAVAKGGTGATTAAEALTNLGAAASSHTHAASGVTAGTLAGKVLANATSSATVTDKQVRNIYAGTTDMTAGTTALTSGDIYVFYE